MREPWLCLSNPSPLVISVTPPLPPCPFISVTPPPPCWLGLSLPILSLRQGARFAAVFFARAIVGNAMAEQRLFWQSKAGSSLHNGISSLPGTWYPLWFCYAVRRYRTAFSCSVLRIRITLIRIWIQGSILRLQAFIVSAYSPPRLYFKYLKLLNFNFNADSEWGQSVHFNADPGTDLSFHFKADPDPYPAFHADLDPQPWSWLATLFVWVIQYCGKCLALSLLRPVNWIIKFLLAVPSFMYPLTSPHVSSGTLLLQILP